MIPKDSVTKGADCDGREIYKINYHNGPRSVIKTHSNI